MSIKFEFEKHRELAEGKLRCPCGNDDWEQFYYVSAGLDGLTIAGCKKCMATHRYGKDQQWRLLYSDKL